jgi:hypothetical protein
MCRQIGENDVNVLMRFAAGDNLFEEVDELRAGVALGGLACTFPVLTSSAAYSAAEIPSEGSCGAQRRRRARRKSARTRRGGARDDDAAKA